MAEKRGSGGSILNFVLRNSLAVGVIVVVLFMFIPLPTAFIDLAMVINLALSFIILLTVIYMKRAADFTSFPRVVLITTIFGLAINISSTRNILVHPVKTSGHMAGQSEMVQAFANIVAGDKVLIGFIIFIILIVVQVLVITKGADRVSEVTARFTLDAMNNKMFTIQNQINNGSITEEEGELKINQLRQEIDFYSAMDGSSKFVSGNVKAGIFITVVNLIGGIVTGTMAGASITDALDSYAKLTIGDGLMSQLPSLLLSFSTGLLITGSNDGDLLSDQLKEQFSANGTIYVIVGATLVALGLAFHNGATATLVPIGILFIFVGSRLSHLKTKEEEQKTMEAEKAKNSPQKGNGGPEEISPVVKLDELSLEIGYALIPLVDDEKGAELMSRVKRIRREAALDLGLVIPPIHIMDQMELSPEEYSFKIRGIEAGRGRLKLGHFMCLNTGNVPKDREIVGEKTKDPAFGMDAIWLPDSKRLEAEKAGYAVIDAPTIIATHLTELIRRNASKILSRQSVSAIIEEIKKTNPVVVDEVTTGDHRFSYGEIEAVLKNLLEEQVSIRNMVVILETLGDYGKLTRDPWTLTEKVREALGAQICQQYADENKVLHVLNLSQSLAQKILDHRADMPGKGPIVAFDPVDARNYISTMSNAVAAVRERNYLPIILCPSEVRRLVKSSTELEMPGIIVLSINEVMAASPNIKVESLGEING
ncbi:flagellar biosynthesis protein FlhA [Treponema succinifaciens]|uniref:Type III secretion FHIPEP protein n=2 Tax=Treponema TaxID=157 RepID=F2NSY4_TRES6|nr:flagellar biosynthesis protein FlhA [Treponema succinifaciens]AEB14436.1 type III secretion FHIPEP protein [Treponema succinifaciens DSM 2489]MCI6912754.1 flagellar biosynthesis protein FlhA [Treponema succinifaciens]